MTPSFLEDIALKISREHPLEKWPEVTVVLPSRRAALFLKKHLLQLVNKPFLAPQIITINEFIEKIAGNTTADSMVLLFELYEAYRENEKTNYEPFETFSKWGQIMLTDFNELDRYLINTQTFFTDLRNIQEIEDWSFSKEELSDSQQKYASFWSKLGSYYQTFTKRCESLSVYSSGKIYRLASEKIETHLGEFNNDSIYIAGFNAISKSEEKIIHTLCSAKKACFLVDADAYYVENKNHEAGIFVRSLFKRDWFASNPIHRHFENIPKKIKISGVPGNTLQATVAGQFLSEIPAEELHNTVVVLADEQLLLPVVNSLPESVDSANITMGYSLRNTTLYTFLSSWFDFQHHIRYDQNGQPKFYSDAVLRLLINSECEALSDKGTTGITEKIIESGKSFLRHDELVSFLGKENSHLIKLFTPCTEFPQDPFDIILSSLSQLHITYTGKKPLQQEFVFMALTAVRKFHSLLEKYPFITDMRTLSRMLMQIIRSESVPFFGEPLKGLQILGMLESRALDFKNVIVLSVNEDILPKGNFAQSLIPYDLKKYYHLPTYTETDAVFAHHFYRLLQRAENVYLLYNSEGDQLGGGEKSRFIYQLEEELSHRYPSVSIENVNTIFTSTDENVSSKLQIQNSKAIITRINALLEKGISPSALSAFIECPLDFYYRYVIGIREEEYEENIDDAKFGIIIHKILQDLYTPLINKILVKEDLLALKKILPDHARKVFAEIMKHADVSSGKNYLSFGVILTYCERAIQNDLQLIDKNELIIKELEKSINGEIEVYPFGEIRTIRLKGICDRIDTLNGTTRIIDYKTGNVNSLMVTATSDKIAEKSKALQLLVYAIMYLKSSGEPQNQTMLYGLRQAGSIELPLKMNGNVIIEPNHEAQLSEILTSIIEKLTDERTVFSHDPDAYYCATCS